MQRESAQFTPFERVVKDASIGAILIEAGRLTPADAKRVLREQAEQNVLFGTAGITLGLISEDDIRYALQRQFDYPCLLPQNTRVSPLVVAAFSPTSPQVEALRALRSQLMLRWLSDGTQPKSLAITSPEHGDGRSWLAANLAVVFSQLGQKTLLLDTDMRNPRLHRWFGLENRIGLAAVLSERSGPECTQSVPDLRGLSILPAGAEPPNPQELLARPTLALLLEQSAKEYDVILIDTPSGSRCADSQMVAARADGTLLVARKHQSMTRSLQRFGDAMRQAGAVIVGAVLNER